MTPKPITFHKRADGWWLKDPNNPQEEWRDVGPYETKAEADDDRKGLLRFWKRNP